MSMTATLAISRQPIGATLPVRRLPTLLVLAAVLLCLLGASSFVQPDQVAKAAVIKPELRAQLEGMSTGVDQSLIVTGASALERNALIPLSSLPVGRLSGFKQIAPMAAGYDTALKCLTQAIYYESANEPELGKRGVAQVVLNRVRHPAYPNSVCGVVYEGANQRVCQFSFTCDGSLLRAPMARQWGESRRIAAEALAGTTVPEVGTATNYHADYVVPRWAFTLGKLAQIGRHIFYRLPGSYGAEGVFTDHWTGVERIPVLDYGRLRAALDAHQNETELAPTATFVPGLTVTPEASDRHAIADVGGRLDTTTTWRMTIPDPGTISSGYRDTVTVQAGGSPSGAAASGETSGEAPGA